MSLHNPYLSRFIEQRPRIIQGGMGIAVSNWRLARRVAQLGEFGVVSGTAINNVVVRELQQGDPFGRRRALAAYPDQEVARYLVDGFFVEGGRAPTEPYKLLPIHKARPTRLSQRILSAAAFSEVWLAKEGHDGLIGINLLAKLKRYTLASLYGAMLAGVDAVLIGAGIPIEEAEQIRRLAAGETARLKLDVDVSQAPDPAPSYSYELDPSDLVTDPQPLAPPLFFPIISSDTLAGILDKKLPEGAVTGWVIESPRAGGHNAPPRGKQYDEAHSPIYTERDQANLARVRALGYPFFLAGGYGSPEKLAEALDAGAMGIQVGSLFSLADESGYPASTKRRLIQCLHDRAASVRTDGRISATGFPFKVLELEGTLGIPTNYEARARICDLGYLQQLYANGDGSIRARCAAEPVETYVAKGGRREDTVRRGCLCNGLMANIGLGQRQALGEERQLFTAGDEILNLPLGSSESPSYTAADVIAYLRGEEVDVQVAL